MHSPLKPAPALYGVASLLENGEVAETGVPSRQEGLTPSVGYRHGPSRSP
jgi:hypothetical protein